MAGPFCNKRINASFSLQESAFSRNFSIKLVNLSCGMEPSKTAFQLEEQITRICHSKLRHEATARVCKAIVWKAHWETGGQYSSCGAFPRASLLLPAVMQDTGLCCSEGCAISDLVAAGGNYNFTASDGEFVLADGACSFLEADYGAASGIGVAGPHLKALWPFAHGSLLVWGPEHKTRVYGSVRSASECQSYCTQLQRCSFFTWSASDAACFLKADLGCPLVRSLTPATASSRLFSGPREGCIRQKGAELFVDGKPNGYSEPTARASTLFKTLTTTSTTTSITSMEARQADASILIAVVISVLACCGGCCAFWALLVWRRARRRAHSTDSKKCVPDVPKDAPSAIAIQYCEAQTKFVPDVPVLSRTVRHRRRASRIRRKMMSGCLACVFCTLDSEGPPLRPS